MGKPGGSSTLVLWQRLARLLLCLFFLSFFFFFFLVFIGLYMRHMEVSRVKVELELQLPAYITATRSKPHLQSTPQLMAMPDP